MGIRRGDMTYSDATGLGFSFSGCRERVGDKVCEWWWWWCVISNSDRGSSLLLWNVCRLLGAIWRPALCTRCKLQQNFTRWFMVVKKKWRPHSHLGVSFSTYEWAQNNIYRKQSCMVHLGASKQVTIRQSICHGCIHTLLSSAVHCSFIRPPAAAYCIPSPLMRANFMIYITYKLFKYSF